MAQCNQLLIQSRHSQCNLLLIRSGPSQCNILLIRSGPSQCNPLLIRSRVSHWDQSLICQPGHLPWKLIQSQLNQIKACIAHMLEYNNLQHANVLSLMVSLVTRHKSFSYYLETKPSETFAPKVFHPLKTIFLKVVYIMLGDSCLNTVSYRCCNQGN